MTASDNCLAFIEKQEGFVDHLYDDAAGNCTVGIGHLVHYGPTNGVDPSEEPYRAGITRLSADMLLRSDLIPVESVIDAYVHVALTQDQYDALCSFVYNVGRGNFIHSTLLRKLNSGDYASVAGEMKRWIFAGGEPLDGLKNRRIAEGNLFNSCGASGQQTA